MKDSSISVHYTPSRRETIAITVADASKSATSRVSKPARLFDSSGSQTWKSAIRQGWNPALRASSATQRVIIFALVSFICALANQAHAQWAWQQIVLRPGWNAVFLEVDPAPEECAALFAGMPVESVWDWNRSADSPQFVQDPGTLIPGAPGWLTWFPPTHPFASQASLFSLRDGRPYLIKLADNAPATTWTVTGRPSMRGISWQPGGVNFVGFHVATGASQTFATLFAGETNLVGQPVYRLSPTGVWERISNLASTGPTSGEGYWVRCKGPATRSALIEIGSASRRGLIFGRNALEQNLQVRNVTTANRTVSVRLLPSATPPAGQPPLAGGAPLEYREANFSQAEFNWKPLTNTLSFSLLPGAEWNVRLAVRRAGLTTAIAGADFQSLLEVTDDLGTRWIVPVRVDPAGASAASGSLSALSNPSSAFAGLWMGEAVINAVSQPAHPGDPNLPRPAGGQFQFRLIVHVDAAGTARLLQHVFLVRKPPTFKPDPENPGYQIVDEPARTVAVTDESLIPQLVGTGELIGRRASSAAFGFKTPLALAGNAFGTGTLNGAHALDYDHPLNPFKHLYHPDHNNMDERFEQKLPEGKEAFTVTRSLSLEFTTTDPGGINPPNWGDNEVGGTYRETIAGLHRMPIRINGNFRLVRVSPAAVLNQ
jgi:hypothetical protein